MRWGRRAPVGVGLVWLATVTSPAAVLAQVRSEAARWVGAPAEEYKRLLQLTGVMPLSSLMIRPTESRETWSPPPNEAWRAPWSRHYRDGVTAAEPAGPRVSLVDPTTLATYNSAIPYGMNDGAMWAGRGLSLAQTVGVRVRVGPVTLDVAPTFTWSENKSFALGPLYNVAPNSVPYADVLLSKTIDRPQRFGDAAVSRLDAGQSSLTAEFRNARAGVSSANMWWGPGIDNALIMTNNAPGFPHAFVGTRRPAPIRIGRLEALWTVGTLGQSAYWRTATDTVASDRWLNSLALVFEPKIAPGMYFGATRLFYEYQRYNPITPRELLTLFQTFNKSQLADSANPLANDIRDQMLSLSFRWVFPSSGFEAYGEWGRNDHNWDWRDMWLQPDLGRAFLVGARKVFEAGGGVLAVRFESTTLSNTLTYMVRPTPVWYAHHLIQQGWTERGQVIGAGIGPGSDGQTFAVDWFGRERRLGWMIQRHRDDLDGFLRAGLKDPYRNDGSLLTGPRVTGFVGRLQLDAQYTFQYELNRYSILHNDARNHRLELRGQYQLP